MTAWEAWPVHAEISKRVAFPESLPIAFATCHADCRAAEFIVEGSTQECQMCGRHMFRQATKDYFSKEG